MPVYYSRNGQATNSFLGVASIVNLILQPAPQYTTLNQLPSPVTTPNIQGQLQYQPGSFGDIRVAYDLVTQYLYGNLGVFSSGIIPITIAQPTTNVAPTTPYDSLAPALRGLQEIPSSFQALGVPNSTYQAYTTSPTGAQQCVGTRRRDGSLTRRAGVSWRRSSST